MVKKRERIFAVPIFICLLLVTSTILLQCGKEMTNQGERDSSANYQIAQSSENSYARRDMKMLDAEEKPPVPIMSSADDMDIPQVEFNTENYDRIFENPFLSVQQNPLSTFSIDVDTASYSNLRRFLLKNGQLPPKGAVRIEELINYFHYDYPQPKDETPFSVSLELSECPWNLKHKLVHIGLQGKSFQPDEVLPPKNLVFLLDVSGSMNDRDKLPLLKDAMELLVRQLNEDDRVAIVVYAGAAGLVLPATKGNNENAILDALKRLEAGGSTNGGQGIQLAYSIARENLSEQGINRVILATDGDFNVGTTNESELIRMIEKERESGIFLTVLGLGTGNYNDSTMEKLADKGNGNYAYIDSISEARKVLVDEIGGTLVTIAKDVKLQIEFNPTYVKAYRLIGYENRMLRNEDFNNDLIDAGEIGAGHTVTALYEIVPPGVEIELPDVDELKYQTETEPSQNAQTNEVLTVKIRYKAPDEDTSQLLTFPLENSELPLSQTSINYKFSAAVAAFGLMLRESEYKADASYEMVLNLAKDSQGADPNGYRTEFQVMVRRAADLAGRPVE